MPLSIETVVQEIPKSPSTSRNTGFPEPLNEDRNTTLPHPEADTSPGATIEGPDPVKASRNRSFRGSRGSRNDSKTSSHLTEELYRSRSGSSVIASDTGVLERLYDDIRYEDGTVEKNGPRASTEGQEGVEIATPPSSNGSLKDEGVGGLEDGDRPESRASSGTPERKKKKGILRRSWLGGK